MLVNTTLSPSMLSMVLGLAFSSHTIADSFIPLLVRIYCIYDVTDPEHIHEKPRRSAFPALTPVLYNPTLCIPDTAIVIASGLPYQDYMYSCLWRRIGPSGALTKENGCASLIRREIS